MLDTTRQTSVRPRSTAANVYEMLRNDIVLGILKPQQPIREAEIAASLSVSRTPVREALLRLSSLGLVDIFPQSGTLVAPIRVEKVRAAQLIREVVEVEVCRRACRVASQEDLEALSSILDEQEFASIRKDMRRVYELDEVFHRRIFETADCLPAADELEDVKTHLNRLRYVTVNWPNRPNSIIAEHRDIVAGLAARDEQATAAAMTMHLRTILQVLENFGSRPQ
jgi:GntR family transcriptional regulator, rspAB operon transcriptional repressor